MLTIPDPARAGAFTSEQWGVLADLFLSQGADIDHRTQLTCALLVHAGDRLSELLALRIVLARHGIADAEVEAVVKELQASAAVDAALDPALAKLAEADRVFRQTLHRLLGEDPAAGLVR
jgi:hypothetical protein